VCSHAISEALKQNKSKESSKRCILTQKEITTHATWDGHKRKIPLDCVPQPDTKTEEKQAQG